MVDIVGTAPAAPLRITVRPNSITRGRDGLRALIAVAAVSIPVAGWFALAGAWPVTLFALVAPLGVALALRHLRRQAGDVERITLARETLTVDRHEQGDVRHLEFNGCWVTLVAHRAASGGCDYLALRSHGHEFPLGRNLTDDERATVGRTLQARLARLRG
jgi:uncharacterized membrane protein